MFPAEKLSNLRAAEFSVLQCNVDRYNAIPWVTSAMSRLCNPEKLETIKLHCEFRDIESRTDEDLIGQGWVQFDDTLVPRRFKSLSELNLVCYNEKNGDESVTLLMNLTEVLERASQDLLMIDCSQGMPPVIHSTQTSSYSFTFSELDYVQFAEPEWIR